MAILSLRRRHPAVRRAAAGQPGEPGRGPRHWSSNQLAYQLAFQQSDFNGAAAISVDLLAVGLVAAVLIVTRTGLFRTED